MNPEASLNENDLLPNNVKVTLDYRLWLGRVISWDGFLPILVSAASASIAAMFPANRNLQTIALLVVPIAAFLCRAVLGHKQIYSNICGPWFRHLQFVALGTALLLLVFFDFIVVLMHFVPKGQRQPPPEDIPIWLCMLGLYIVFVVFAMYPGRKVTLSDSIG